MIGRSTTNAVRVTRCHQKRLMLGGLRINLWIDKETADALSNLEKCYDPVSRTKIISYLIREASTKTKVSSAV